MRPNCLRALGAAAAALVLPLSAHAALITLDTVNTSTADASVYSTIESDYNTTGKIVSSLPYTDPSTADGATGDFSTVTPNLSDSALDFTYSQTLTNAADYFADSDGDIFFVAGPNTAFSLTGTQTSDGTTDELYVQLVDRTAQQQIFNADLRNSSTLSLGSNPITGVLTPGDTYEFFADENMHNGQGPDPTLAGSVLLTFSQAVPEPTAALLLVGAAIASRTRNRNQHQQSKENMP